MTDPEVAQLEMFAQIDELIRRLSQWSDTDSPWEPMNGCRAIVRRLLSRLETLRIRLESPLVVATFGGTGTGKSTLVNALVERDCTKAGRERPTTTRPVLIVHPATELDALGLNLEEFEVVRCDSSILRDIVIIDCPDPDTTETETPGSNLQRLHHLLPHCDVLIYTSTQQKYRSARVVEELGQAATGCRLLFVQTHADIDDDIREDWRSQLEASFDVPELFFVDSVRALEEQQANKRPSGDFGRLIDVLTTQLAASQRIQIRRANVLDLIQTTLEHCRQQLAANRPAVDQLEAALEEQRQKLISSMSKQLGDELQLSRYLWERRLLSAVTQIWGFSPFSSVLRFYNGMGNLVASVGMFRARNSAQMALLGALQGAKWLSSRQKEKAAENQLARLGSFGLDDSSLREAQLVISGYVQDAKLDRELASQKSLDHLRSEAVRVEDQFLGDASRRIDGIIDELAQKNSRWLTRMWYEFLFVVYVGFVLFRVGKNFFYDSFLKEFIEGADTVAVELISIDFYISAGLFFVLWSGILVMLFTRRLRRGLQRKITDLADELARSRISQGLFPRLEETCRDIENECEKLDAAVVASKELRDRLATSSSLGSITPLASTSEAR